MDRLEIKVREEVVFTIFQFNPKAYDLRQIITYQDVTHNLERIGDILLNVIHFSKKTNLNIDRFEKEKQMIHKMLQYTSEMLRNAVFSFSNGDSLTAYKVITEDDKVDELFKKVNTSLLSTFSDNKLSKQDIQNIMNINSISYNLERIGDSATNIAESTIFMVEGKDIRHGNK